jgi:hypothetical protein
VRGTLTKLSKLNKQRLATCLTLVIATAALGGCGGSGSDSSATVAGPKPATAAGSEPPSPAVARKAEAICATATSKAHRLRATISDEIAKASSAEAGLTAAIVAPAIEILEAESRGLAALRPRPDSAAFTTFVGLFEPVIDLAYQRRASGEANEIETSRELELLVSSLTEEQVKLARSLGLPACETDFFEALGTAQ